MSKDDKFIKEKLDLVNQIDTDEEVPESLIEKCHALAQSLPKTEKPVPARKNTKLVSIFSACVVAIVAIVLPCVLLLPSGDGEERYFYDTDLISRQVTREELAADFNILTTEDYWSAVFAINVDAETKTDVNAYAQYALEYGDLEVVVVLTDRYIYPFAEQYTTLAIEEESTELFTYKYRVVPKSDWAVVTLEYGGYKYYINYDSEYPEEICDIMSSFTI